MTMGPVGLRSVVLIVVLALALPGCARASEGPALPHTMVRPDRPRIYLRPEELDAWRQRFQRIPELKAVYAATRGTVMGLAAPSSNGYVSSMELQDLALFYLTEDRGREPLAKAKQWMDSFADNQAGDYWSYGLITRAMSLAYDWLYPDLTREERERYGKAIVHYAEAAMGNAPHDLPAGADWNNQVSDYYNQFYWHYGGTPFAAIALSGADGFQEVAGSYLAKSEEWIRHHMLPATNQAGDGGGWFESLGYNNMMTLPFAHLLEAWRTGTGEDLFPQSTLLPGNSAWVVHSLIPHSQELLPLDDMAPGAHLSKGVDAEGSLAPLLAQRYHDPYAQYITQTVFDGRDSSSVMNFPYLLWYQPDLPRLDFATIEKGRLFAGLGQVSMRSGWGKEDALVVYRAGRVYGGHGHPAAGHFLFYRKGDLLVQDGYRGEGPEGHNTLYIGGEMRAPAQGAPQHFLAQMDGTAYDYGRILGYYHDPSFSRYHWVDSDLTRAYTPQQASRVARRLVFLPPRTVLVIDSISSPEGVQKRFRLHAPSPPQLDQANRMASWTDGDGKLFVKTVLPADVSLEASHAKQSYLFTVSRPRPVSEEALVHLLYAADLDEAAPEATTLETSEGFVGVLVQIPSSTWAVVFRTDGKQAAQVTYTVPLASQGRGRVNHLVADLSGDSCQITGAAQATLKLQGGPLRFDSGGGGTFTLRASGK
jgi:hypothetical protein